MAEFKKLGFGLMRLPMQGEDIDLEQVKAMADLFLERGFTYFDTAYGYTGGKSEMAVKEVLVKRHPRESFLLATKLPAWAGPKTAKEAQDMLYTSLERTGAGYFDYYLLHSMGGNRTKVFDDFGIWSFLAQRKREGVIRHLGFSFHDSAEALDDILTAHPEADFVQLQINYADWDDDRIQSRRCYEVARKHGKPIIIMEPVKGGSLANLPAHVAKPLTDLDAERSLSSWALRFAASLPGVLTVLSGMSDLGQVDDNTRTLAAVQPLTQEERQALLQVVENLKTTRRVPCTDCRYCVKGCPQGVKIPAIFDAYNTYLVYNHLEGARGSYRMRTQDGGGARNCIACGACEEVFPKKIDFIHQLRDAAELLDPQA